MTNFKESFEGVSYVSIAFIHAWIGISLAEIQSYAAITASCIAIISGTLGIIHYIKKLIRFNNEKNTK